MESTGKFIVFEGLDGCGKTTVSKKICEYLQNKNIPSIWSKEPTDFPTGKKIRNFLKGEIDLSPEQEIQSFLDDREVSVSKIISPNLEKNINVILDRYYYSTAAYQSSKDYPAKKVLERNLEKKFPIPDLVLFLDISPEESLKRIEKRLNLGEKKERFETIQQLTIIRQSYKEVLPPSVVIIDATKSLEEVENLCLEKILSLLQSA
ncbi:MAG: dTMP kinase [Leptospiraceae bacterium]|nr:dTMP kinase [Leptospiraceae bacterium]MCK6381289.1 dTMP kinase [Leptospiraceae bacterium]NUM40398.1 dTMP kinase [Leptospiraceae bacterium]